MRRPAHDDSDRRHRGDRCGSRASRWRRIGGGTSLAAPGTPDFERCRSVTSVVRGPTRVTSTSSLSSVAWTSASSARMSVEAIRRLTGMLATTGRACVAGSRRSPSRARMAGDGSHHRSPNPRDSPEVPLPRNPTRGGEAPTAIAGRARGRSTSSQTRSLYVAVEADELWIRVDEPGERPRDARRASRAPSRGRAGSAAIDPRASCRCELQRH